VPLGRKICGETFTGSLNATVAPVKAGTCHVPNADQVALIAPWCPESDSDDPQPPTGYISEMNISDGVGMMFGRRR